MRSSIFIPKTINVGFQSRNDTYTKKLAYVIYYDEKGKLRKEASWNNWRDDKIPNEEFDNMPTSGFVLNKKVGGYSSGWNHRQAYVRIYDPRNFEFEISVENLLYILENTNSIKGKGLEGDFVYGWDGKDLVLIPTLSPDYKEIESYNKIVHNNLEIKNKDLILGATYIDKNNNEYIYMGKFDYFKSESIGRIGNSWKYEVVNKKKYHFFAEKSKYSDSGYYFSQFKSIAKKFIACTDEECHKDYATIFDKLERNTSYSPLDESKYQYASLDYDELAKRISDNRHNEMYVMSSDKVKHYIKQRYDETTKKYIDDEFYCYTRTHGNYGYNEYRTIPEGFKTETIEVKNTWNYRSIKKEVMIPVSLEEIHNIINPLYRKRYLANGKFYDEECAWNE